MSLENIMKSNPKKLKNTKQKLLITLIFSLLSAFLILIDLLFNFDINREHLKIFNQYNEEFVQIEKRSSNNSEKLLHMNDDEVNLIQNQLEKKTGIIYRVQTNTGYADQYKLFHIYDSSNPKIEITYGDSAEIEIVEDDGFEYLDKFKLIGRKPLAKNEIVISSIIADDIIKKGIILFNSEKAYMPKNYQDILENDKTYYFGNLGSVKIVGIIDYGVNFAKEENKILFYAKLRNVYNKVYAKDGFINELVSSISSNGNYNYRLSSEDDLLNEKLEMMPNSIQEMIEYFDGNNWTTTKSLNEKEIVLNIRQLKNFNILDYQRELVNYMDSTTKENQLDAEKEFLPNYIKKYHIIDSIVNLHIFNDNVSKYEQLKVIGITGLSNNNYYLSSNAIEKDELYRFPITGIYVLENSQKSLENLMSIFSGDKNIFVKTTYTEHIKDLNPIIDNLKWIIPCISVIIAILFIIFLVKYLLSNNKKIDEKRKNDSKSIFKRVIAWILVFCIFTILIEFFAIHFLNSFFESRTDGFISPFTLNFKVVLILMIVIYDIMIFIKLYSIINKQNHLL